MVANGVRKCPPSAFTHARSRVRYW